MSKRGSFAGVPPSGGGPVPPPAGVAPPEVRFADETGVAVPYARQDHTHRGAVAYLDQTAPDTNVIGNRSADQSATTAGVSGATNLGNDSTGKAGGVTTDFATLIGGDACTAGGYACAVIGGENCAVTGEGGASIGGVTNAFAGFAAGGVGGGDNVSDATASYSGQVGGRFNSCFASYTGQIGGLRNSASALAGSTTGIGSSAYVVGQYSHASGQTENAAGNRQFSRIVMRGDTPGVAANESVQLGFGGFNAAPTDSVIPTQNNKWYMLKIRSMSAIVSGAPAGNGKSFEYNAWAYNEEGIVTIYGAGLVASDTTPAAATHAIAVGVDGTNGITVTGQIGDLFTTQGTRWVADVEILEIKAS